MIARDLGVPITSPNLISYRLGKGFLPGGHDLLCWTTTAESGGYFTAHDLASGTTISHPLHSLEAYPIVLGTDGIVYVGSTTGGVMRWDPKTNEWNALGPPIFAMSGARWNHVRVLAEGRDGWLYAGSCYGERARIHRETGEVQTLPSTPEAGNWYVSSIAVLPNGRIAFGYGHQARIFVYDPSEGKDVGQWAPSQWLEDGFCITLVMARTVLYATHFPSGRRAAFDSETGAFLGQIPWPDARSGQFWSVWRSSSGYGNQVDFYVIPGTDTCVACDGEKVYQYDPRQPELGPVMPLERFHPEGALALEMGYSVTNDCRVLAYDERRLKVARSFAAPQPAVERGLFALGVGPDGRVYGGAYQSTQVFSHDPATGQTTVLGDHHPGWSGETYSFAVSEDDLILANYTNGAMVAYTPAEPWSCEMGQMVNPRRLSFLGQRVYRPYSTCVADDGTIWSVGAAGWGSTGGGIAWIDKRSGETGAVALPEAPVNALALPDNRILSCHSERLRWWDGASKRELADCEPPVHLVSADSLGEDGLVLLASATEILVLSIDTPGSVRIKRRFESPIPCVRALAWNGYAVVGGPQGFALVDAVTGVSDSFCEIPLGSRWAFVIVAGRVFFHRETHLMSVALPKYAQRNQS